MSQDHAQSGHVTDEDLMLDYYGERSSEQRAAIRAHLDVCESCQALDQELRGVLALVDTEPVPEAPEGFEREMWATLEPIVSGFSRTSDVVSGFSRTSDVVSGFLVAPKPRGGEGDSRPDSGTFWKFELPRWAFAAGVAALAVGAFALGRVWDSAPVTGDVASGVPALSEVVGSRTSPAADAKALGERLLRSEVEEHLERSQRVLVELANADDSAPVMLASDRAQAADLVAAGRLYRLTAGEMGDTETRDLLEDVERVLVDVANGPDVETSNDLSGVRARISSQDLIFRLRVTTSAMRARERRDRPTW